MRRPDKLSRTARWLRLQKDAFSVLTAVDGQDGAVWHTDGCLGFLGNEAVAFADMVGALGAEEADSVILHLENDGNAEFFRQVKLCILVGTKVDLLHVFAVDRQDSNRVLVGRLWQEKEENGCGGHKQGGSQQKVFF